MKRMTKMVSAAGATAMLAVGVTVAATPASAAYHNVVVSGSTWAACNAEKASVLRDLRSQGLKPFVLAERDCSHNGTNYSALVEWNS